MTLFGRILLAILLMGAGIHSTFACPVQPDIINEFRIDTATPTWKAKIHYTLMSWRNLHTEILYKLYDNAQSESMSKVANSWLLANAHFFVNDKEVHLSFLSGNIVSYSGSYTDDTYIPETLLEMDFDSDMSSDFLASSTIRLEFNKKLFQDITPLIHAYAYTDIQKDGKETNYMVKDNRTYFVYIFGWKEYGFRDSLVEGNPVNTHTLFIEPLLNTTLAPVDASRASHTMDTNNLQKSFSSWFSVWEYLQKFLQGNGSFLFKTLWLLIAVFAGMMHGLLPGHSKSLIGTYVISNSAVRYREVMMLVGSVTFSHTFFIFILAMIILAFQKWLGATVAHISFISSLGYILFGIYFCIKWVQSLKKIKTQTQNSLFERHTISVNDNKHEGCSCHEHTHKKNSGLKWTLLSGLLAGCNPCIDALALFTFAVSIWNGIYAFFIILFFSLGLWMTLGIISLLVKQSQRLLSDKSKALSEKVSANITFLAGILIVIMGFSGIILR